MGHEILIVAGEASADLHASRLVAELRARRPELGFFGVGGKSLAQQGMQLSVKAERLNVVGIADWRDKVREVLGAYRDLKQEILRRRPQAAVLLDLPDFNLRLARFLKRQGIPVVYYISPQVWAWRRYRVRTIRRYVDKMLVVFPFEKKFYQERGVDVEFVGHPLLETLHSRAQTRPAAEVLAAPRIALLPGSRTSELRYHASLLQGLARRLLERYPAAEIRIPVAPTLSAHAIAEAIPHPAITLVEGDSRETLAWADCAVVASGTATLETALVGTPFCLFYRLSRTTSWIVRHLVRYRRFFGMPNVLLGGEIAREFLQEDATPDALMQECRWLIESAAYREWMAAQLKSVRCVLGSEGATERAATQVLRTVDRQPQGEVSSVPSLA